MTMAVFLTVFILFVGFLASASALSCLSCKDVRNTTECSSKEIICGRNEKCFTSTSGRLGDRLFTLGCDTEQACNGITSAAGLVGRKKRASSNTNCHQCCSHDRCNDQLCSKFDQVVVPSSETCEDNPAVNCSQLSSFTPICADVDHAKTICKNWCGLCNIVDGAWTDWSAWSSCSVSCGDGQMTRTRTCTDPPPSHGGHDCIGSNTDSLRCHHRASCQVDGGWGAWLPWQACSVTQGTGLRRRIRNCDSPAPSSHGRDCRGSDIDFDMCSKKQPNVTFYIRGAKSLDVAAGDKVLYKTTLVDTSGSYNNSTGVFTAPVDGLYTFTVTVSVIYKHLVGLQIKTTSGPGQLGELLHRNDQQYATSTMTGVGELQAGSQVWVQCLYASAGDELYNSWDRGYQNSFQGALIRAT